MKKDVEQRHRVIIVRTDRRTERAGSLLPKAGVLRMGHGQHIREGSDLESVQS